MSSTYLSPPSIFTSKRVATIMEAYLPITALSVSEKLVYRFCFLALYCLACFSNTCFMLPFASWVASAPIPVSLWLGNGIVRLKYWRKPVLILNKKKHDKTKKPTTTKYHPASEKQWNLFCHLQCCYTTQGRKHPLPLLLLEQLANVYWFDVDVSVNHTYQEPPPQI